MSTSRHDESGEMRCRGCAYDLRGLAAHRCPECGRGFDPAKPETFLWRPVRAGRLLIFAIASLPLMALPIVSIRLGWIQRGSIWLTLLHPLSIFTGFVLAVVAAQESITLLRARHPWVEHRWVVLPTAIISITLLCTFLFGTYLYEWLMK